MEAFNWRGAFDFEQRERFFSAFLSEFNALYKHTLVGWWEEKFYKLYLKEPCISNQLSYDQNRLKAVYDQLEKIKELKENDMEEALHFLYAQEKNCFMGSPSISSFTDLAYLKKKLFLILNAIKGYLHAEDFLSKNFPDLSSQTAEECFISGLYWEIDNLLSKEFADKEIRKALYTAFVIAWEKKNYFL